MHRALHFLACGHLLPAGGLIPTDPEVFQLGR
jgi:hypothetical protein